MELSGLHSKACKMWKDKDSLVAGHFWGGGGRAGRGGELTVEKEWEPNFKAQ